jgi:hypothetical protein
MAAGPAFAAFVRQELTMITQTLRPDFNTRETPALHFLGLPTLLRATAQTTNGAFGLVEG